MPLGPQDPKYSFPAFSTLKYRRRYLKHVSYKDTSLCIMEPQLRLGAGGGVGTLIWLSTQAVVLTQDWLKITMDHAKGYDW